MIDPDPSDATTLAAVRTALGASPGESLLDAAQRVAGEVERLRRLVEPTRGDLINRAASLGAEAVRMVEQADRMPTRTPAECEAKHAAVMRAGLKSMEANKAWFLVRATMEARDG